MTQILFRQCYVHKFCSTVFLPRGGALGLHSAFLQLPPGFQRFSGLCGKGEMEPWRVYLHKKVFTLVPISTTSAVPVLPRTPPTTVALFICSSPVNPLTRSQPPSVTFIKLIPCTQTFSVYTHRRGIAFATVFDGDPFFPAALRVSGSVCVRTPNGLCYGRDCLLEGLCSNQHKQSGVST